MKVASFRSCIAIQASGCRMAPPCAAFSAQTHASSPSLHAHLADTSRTGSNSQASSSARSVPSSSRLSRTRRTACALQPVPFRPSKLTIQRLPGTLQSGACPLHPRCYTLTHNDLTGQLLLTIGHQYNRTQLSGWYSRLLRDEILAYWQFSSDQPVLHIECHISGNETWLAPPFLRDYIFRREMPLVLNVINFAEAALLADNPAMAEAHVMVHLASHVPAYHATVMWGKLSDCSSWLPPPRWARARLTTPGSSPTVLNLTSTADSQHTLKALPQQSLGLTSDEERLQDQPCVLSASDLESSMHLSRADRLESNCQGHAEAHTSRLQQTDADAVNAAACSPLIHESSMSSHRRPRQNSACYRLHVACTAAVRAMPGQTQGQGNGGFQHTALSFHSKHSGLAYHVPPRLCNFIH